MSLLNKIFKKDENKEIEDFKKKAEKAHEQAAKLDEKNAGRICSACNQPGADKKFGGQHWHRKCLRRMKKMAKGMI